MTSCCVGGVGSAMGPIQMYIQQAAQASRNLSSPPMPTQGAPLPAGMGLKIDTIA